MSGARTAVLGLRVADAHRGRVVVGLRAWAWDARLDKVHGRRAEACVHEASRGFDGVLAWHRLPPYSGRGGWSEPHDADAFNPWTEEGRREHSVVVVDPTRHLQPVRLQIRVPHRDLVPWTWGDGDVRPSVRAYASPVHPIPDGFAAVRARLWDPDRGTPAAWALLVVQANGHPCAGLAGEDGEVVVFVPLPRLRTDLAPSAQAWPLKVAVRYAHRDAATPAPPPHTDLHADLPPLATIEQQPWGQIHATWAVGVSTPFIPPPLTVRGELYFASETPPDRPREHRLFVTATA